VFNERFVMNKSLVLFSVCSVAPEILMMLVGLIGFSDGILPELLMTAPMLAPIAYTIP